MLCGDVKYLLLLLLLLLRRHLGDLLTANHSRLRPLLHSLLHLHLHGLLLLLRTHLLLLLRLRLLHVVEAHGSTEEPRLLLLLLLLWSRACRAYRQCVLRRTPWLHALLHTAHHTLRPPSR